MKTTSSNYVKDRSWTEDCEELARIFGRLDASGKVEVLNAAYREKIRCLNQCVNDNDAIGWQGAIKDRSLQ